jgi:beta-barrel assembly-enhancing protease
LVNHGVQPKMRTFHAQVMAAVLAVGVMSSLSANGQKNENNPSKVGHRRIAHKSIISPEKEREIGEHEAEQFENSVSLIRDPEIDGYLSTVAGNIVSHSDWKGLIALRVLKSSDVKTLSLPGAHIYLSSGLLVAAENEDEIAGAIAHQVAHAAARHWAFEMARTTLLSFAMPAPTSASLGSLPTTALSSMTDFCCLAFPGGGALQLGYLKSLSDDELEADLLALQYVYEAGYDPSTYIALLRSLTPFNPKSVGLPETFVASPAVAERVAKAEDEIRQSLRGGASQAKTSPEFLAMKARLGHDLKPRL